MATEDNYSINVTVSQPTLNLEGGDLSHTMRITFGRWFRGDIAHPDWNERDENAAGYIRNRPEFRGEGPVEVEESEKLVTVSLSESLLAKIYAVTESFWLSPLSWVGQQQWKS